MKAVSWFEMIGRHGETRLDEQSLWPAVMMGSAAKARHLVISFHNGYDLSLFGVCLSV